MRLCLFNENFKMFCVFLAKIQNKSCDLSMENEKNFAYSQQSFIKNNGFAWLLKCLQITLFHIFKGIFKHGLLKFFKAVLDKINQSVVVVA